MPLSFIYLVRETPGRGFTYMYVQQYKVCRHLTFCVIWSRNIVNEPYLTGLSDIWSMIDKYKCFRPKAPKLMEMEVMTSSIRNLIKALSATGLIGLSVVGNKRMYKEDSFKLLCLPYQEVFKAIIFSTGNEHIPSFKNLPSVISSRRFLILFGL